MKISLFFCCLATLFIFASKASAEDWHYGPWPVISESNVRSEALEQQTLQLHLLKTNYPDTGLKRYSPQGGNASELPTSYRFSSDKTGFNLLIDITNISITRSF